VSGDGSCDRTETIGETKPGEERWGLKSFVNPGEAGRNRSGEAYTIGSVKHCVSKYDGDRREPIDFAKPGGPPSDIVEAISKVLNEEPFSSTTYVAARLRTNRELVKRTLTNVLGMRKFSLYWVPRTLAVAQKRQQVVDSQWLLRALTGGTANGFTKIITADESWCYWSSDHSLQWSASRDQVPTRELNTIDAKKSMLTLIFSGHSLLPLDHLLKGCKMNSQYFCDFVPEEAKRAVTALTGKNGIEGMNTEVQKIRFLHKIRGALQNLTLCVRRNIS
jgi:hypothetical protein